MAALSGREDTIPSLYVKTFEGCSPQASEQSSIRSIFKKAHRMEPFLLIFEDLDSLIIEKTRSFLNDVDGIESNDGILMVGSINHLEKLDPAIRDRLSRFDRKYFFKLPEQPERAAYAKNWQNKLAQNSDIGFSDQACEIIARMTEGFSFACLKELFLAALLTVARGGAADDVPSAPSTDNGYVKVQSEKSEEASAKEPAKDEKTQAEEDKATVDKAAGYL